MADDLDIRLKAIIPINISGKTVFPLFLRKARNSNRTVDIFYDFPGGQQDGDETIEEALIREVKEELNIEIEVGEQISDMPHPFEKKAEQGARMIFVACKHISGEPVNVLEDEHEALAFVSSQTIIEYLEDRIDQKTRDYILSLENTT